MDTTNNLLTTHAAEQAIEGARHGDVSMVAAIKTHPQTEVRLQDDKLSTQKDLNSTDGADRWDNHCPIDLENTERTSPWWLIDDICIIAAVIVKNNIKSLKSEQVSLLLMSFEKNCLTVLGYTTALSLFVCRFMQKTTKQVSMYLGGGMRHGPRKNQLHYGANPDKFFQHFL